MMTKVWRAASICLALLCGALAAGAALALDNAAKSRYSIKDVMITAYKEKLATRVVKGEATAEDKERLLVLYEALAKTAPPRGDATSWKKKTEALVKAAEAAIEGQSNAPVLLKKTMECGACHTRHK